MQLLCNNFRTREDMVLATRFSVGSIVECIGKMSVLLLKVMQHFLTLIKFDGNLLE